MPGPNKMANQYMDATDATNQKLQKQMDSTDQQELDTVTSPSCSILANLIILGYSMVSRIPQSRILAAEVENPMTDVQ